MALVFGRVPLPERIQLHDLVSNGINTAWDDLGARRLLGSCTHRMVGSLAGTDTYFAGEARNRSLTDFGIGGPWDGIHDGDIYQWIPRGSNAAPWANGPANDLQGDGIAYVQQLGINAVNRDIRSIELSDGGNISNPYGPQETPKHFAAHVQLVAYLFDQAEVPWDQFPYNPHVGIVTYLEHWEIGPKECPFAPVRAKTETTQNAVRAILKQHQTGAGTKPEPIPPVVPIQTQPYSANLDLSFLRQSWGAPRRVYLSGAAYVDPDTGKTKTYPYRDSWVPCAAWIHRARTELEYPKALDWESVPPTKHGPTSTIRFSNGWALLHFDDERGWRWAGAEDKAV